MKKTNLYKILSVSLCIVMTLGLFSCGSGKAEYDISNAAGIYDSSMSYREDVGYGEQYTEITENGFINTAENNKSFFSVDANTSSYPNLRSLIKNGNIVPVNSVRIEEMLNYFDYEYRTPENDDIFALNASIFDNPYNPETKLMTIGLAAKEVEFESVKNNLVFLIDTSGSMYSNDKLPLVQQAFTMLAAELNDTDCVSIVTYAGDSGVALDGGLGKDKQMITAVIQDLQAGGSTAGSKGIETAYAIAEKHFIKGGNNRVILATDGDFNVGLRSNEELENFISKKRETGVYFSVFSVGRGNTKMDLMETLALNGNGTASYIDSVKEAKRALVEQIGGTMITVAKDVKTGIEFNPDYVESYRLIGYENKLLTEDEFNDSETDAGEIGSGHTITVVYEIKQKEGAEALSSNPARVIVRYKPTENVDGDLSEKELNLDVLPSYYHTEMTDTDKFISSVIEFGLILRDSEFKANANLKAVSDRLGSIELNDEYKQEFRNLVSEYRLR